MEAKTMGKFIAALRKANGMTQKDLAEKLNVSDKSVSRWERDEGAPDLSLIPVIAEVFGVSCDELLRGERKPAARRQEQSEEKEEITRKAEKQRKHILKSSLTKYHSKSLIAGGIALLGLFAAMICNLGYLRAYLGFFAGSVFYLMGAVCQAVFMNNALLSVAEEDEADSVTEFRQDVRRTGKGVIFLCALLFAGTLPLITLPWDTYMGIGAGDWALEGIKYSILAFAVFLLINHFSEGFRLKKAPGTAAEKNWRLKSRIGAACVALMVLITGIGGKVFDANLLVDKYSETFTDFDRFKAYMEKDVHRTDSLVGFTAIETTEFNENGEPVMVPAEYWYPEDEVRLDDGTPEGKLLGTVTFRNSEVGSYSVDKDKAGNPVFLVATQEDYEQARQAHDRGMLLCGALCALTAAGGVIVYKAKRIKV